jgi:pseudouridine-5'-phosphate glycosidase
MATIATKTARVLQSSASNAAGATTTGSCIDLTTALGMTVTAKITNGSTGPTVGCSFLIDISHDGTNWKEFSRQTAGTSNSAVAEFIVDIPAAVMYLRSRFTGNTGQAVTVEAFGHELTSIG